MRVISQYGTIDVPYELTSIQLVSKTTIVAQGSYFGSGNDNFATIAEYSTEENAKKAMEMLRDAYIGMPIVMQNVDISEGVMKEFERLKKCGIVVQTENQPSKIECISNAIFQFPTEEELE